MFLLRLDFNQELRFIRLDESKVTKMAGCIDEERDVLMRRVEGF